MSHRLKMTTDTIKQLGAEFHRAADSLADTMAQLDNARLERLTFLAALKEAVRTLPEQIAKWDAEAARLESQTAEDPLRAVVAEQSKADKQPGEHVTAAAFDPSRHEGGPDGVLCLHFAGIPAEFFAHHATWETPSGKQMGSADVLALAAREWRPVGTTWAEVKARVMQPTVKPAEDEDPIEKAFWRYCMLIDKTQKTARVKAGYLEAPYPNRDAFKIAVRSTVLGLGVPAASSKL